MRRIISIGIGIGIAGAAIIGIIELIGAILRNDILLSVIIAGLLFIIGVLVAGGRFAPARDVYLLGGALIAWVLLYPMLYLWSPEVHRAVATTSSFWAFQIMFFIIFGLLGRVGFAVFLVRLVSFSLLVLFGLSAFLSLTSPETTAKIKRELRIKQIKRRIQDIKNNHLEAQIAPHLGSLEKLRKASKKRMLTEGEMRRLKILEAELKKIIPPLPVHEGKTHRRLIKNTVEVPAGEKVGTGIIVTPKDIRRGAWVRLIQIGQPKVYWFANGGVRPDIKIDRRLWSIKIIGAGEVKLVGGPEPTEVRVQLFFP